MSPGRSERHAWQSRGTVQYTLHELLVYYAHSTCGERPIFESRRSDPVVGLVIGA